MSNESIASNTFPLIDVPEPTDFKVSFQYFGFAIEEVLSSRAGTQEVNVSFTTVADTTEFGGLGSSATTSLATLTTTEQDVVGSLESGHFLDESVSETNFTSMVLQDYYLSEKSTELLNAVAQGLNIDLENLAPTDGASAITSAILEGTGIADSTVGSTALPSEDPGLSNIPSISDEILSAILQQEVLDQSLESLEDISSGETILGILGGIQHIHTVDSRLTSTVAKASAQNPFGSFSGNISYMITEMEGIQATARSLVDPNVISSEAYEFSVVPIAATIDGPNHLQLGEAIVAGYLIEKTELSQEGEAISYSNFFISQPVGLASQSTTFTDVEISLATSYSYAISTIAVARIPSVQYGEPTEPNLQDVDVVLKSRVQTSLITTGLGFPESPSDISFFYDSSQEKLLINWDFGGDAEDTKKFQIFRRNNIKEPFLLMRQYDFDETNASADESVDFGLNVKMDQPLTYYIDEEFIIDKEYIYSLSSIGKTGASSPLSEQYSVIYDSISGRLNIKQVSVSGAPKPYPNFYLENTLTKSVQKTSNVSNLDFYFTPEVYNVTRNVFDPVTGDPIDTVILDFLKKSGVGKYLLEVTELGTMQQSIFETSLDVDGEMDLGLILDPTSV